jgi:hypothetical protein
MTRCAIIEVSTGNVINVIEYDEVPTGTPDGMEGDLIAVPTDIHGPGDRYENGEFIDMRPVLEKKPEWVPPGTAVMFDHENRVRALEGQPPLTMEDFVVKMRGV